MARNLHDELDALALEIERTIAENERVLENHREAESDVEFDTPNPVSDDGTMSLFS